MQIVLAFLERFTFIKTKNNQKSPMQMIRKITAYK